MKGQNVFGIVQDDGHVITVEKLICFQSSAAARE